MPALETTEPKATPPCPHCGGELELKKVQYESVLEYFFTCLQCAIDYTNDRTNRRSA
jgi:hypothetical protein